MNVLSDGLRLRAAEPTDVVDLLDLFLAVDQVDVGHPDSDEEDVRWRWREPSVDIAKDTCVVEVAGGIVAYALTAEGQAEVLVHPDHRGRGIGSFLARAVEHRAADRRDSPDGFIRQNVTSKNTAAHALLRDRGYSESHFYARMEIAMDDPPEVPEVPDDVTLRTFRVGEDERPVYEAECAAWAEYPRWRDEGFERWSNVFEGDDFDPSAWLVALEGDRVVGFSQNLGYLDMGWVQNLGTIPEARGRGLGEFLLRKSFRVYWDRGIRRVGLSVSSERSPAAWRLYERCGMTEVLRYTNYCKPLDTSGAGFVLSR